MRLFARTMRIASNVRPSASRACGTWGRTAMSETADEARNSALEQAAQATAAGPGGVRAVVGDVPGFLRAYYRHVATEDLVAFGSERMAAVAAAHAALAADRPQGRPLVRVVDADPG